MIKIGVSGAGGKMGKLIINLARASKDFEVVFGLERKGHPDVNKVLEGIRIVDDGEEIKTCDCLIEFTAPQATIEHLNFLVKFNKCAVIGTTGLTNEQKNMIKEASQKAAIVFSPNMSIGVNLLFTLVKRASGILKDYKAKIKEAHHIHKKDAPSGTAKRLAQIVNEAGFNVNIKDIEAVREDEIVGDHKIVFESGVDKLILFHSAKSRDIFAQGALKAAAWVMDKPPGLYSMEDVLFKR